MKVKCKDLKEITDLFFQKLEQSNNLEVDLSEDFYWSVSTKAIYDPYKKPEESEMSLGQLSHDWHALLKFLDGKNELSSLELKWLAEIFRFLSHKVIF